MNNDEYLYKYKKKILLDFMYVDNEKKTKFIIYGIDIKEYYFIIKKFIKINFFFTNEDTDRKEFRGIPIINKKEILQLAKIDKINIRIIIFSINFAKTANDLIKYGFDPFKQLFDGEFIFGNSGDENVIKSRNKYRSQNEIIITTATYHSEGGIYQFNIEKNDFNLIKKGDFRGIVKYKNGYLAVDEKIGLIHFDSNFNVLGKIEIKNADVHGIAIDPSNNNYVYISETASDLIGKYNVANKMKEDYINLFRENKNNCYHINDLLIDNNNWYICLMSLKGKFQKNNNWQADGCILKFDPIKNNITKVIKRKIYGPHSLFVYQDKFIFSNSLAGEVIYDNNVICKFNGFTRGMYFDGGILYIGQSKYRSLTHPQFGFKGTSNDAGIHFYIPSIRMSSFIPMPFAEQIYCIISK